MSDSEPRSQRSPWKSARRVIGYGGRASTEAVQTYAAWAPRCLSSPSSWSVLPKKREERTLELRSTDRFYPTFFIREDGERPRALARRTMVLSLQSFLPCSMCPS